MGTQTKPKKTEAEMLALLRARHGEIAGNGAAYAFVTGVRSAAGFDAKRTLDAVAMSLWPSRGLLLDGFEVKCSRSDWQRELKAPEKAEEFCRLLDRFWIVAGDAEIVREGELPPGWGLLVVHGSGLRVTTQAKMLHEQRRGLPEGFGRSFLACLLREAVRVGVATPQEILDAEERGREDVRRRSQDDRQAWKPMYDELRTTVREFERELGVPIAGYWSGVNRPGAKDVGKAMRMVLTGETEFEALRKRLEYVAMSAESIAQAARERAEALGVVEDA